MVPKKQRVNLAGKQNDRLCILDAGAQYGKVIDRRVRELSVVRDCRSTLLRRSWANTPLIASAGRNL